jgi:hypothetical protein
VRSLRSAAIVFAATAMMALFVEVICCEVKVRRLVKCGVDKNLEILVRHVVLARNGVDSHFVLVPAPT